MYSQEKKGAGSLTGVLIFVLVREIRVHGAFFDVAL